MQHAPLRRTPAAVLVSILSLAVSLLLGSATPVDAATPMAGTGEEKDSFEISISSNDEVTTTFLGTAPPDAEQKLKDSCTEENFTVDGKKTPTVTFSSESGTPTCTAVLTVPVSDNKYVTHDGDEYVVDTSVDSESNDGAGSQALSVVFPGKVTDAGGGRIEGDKKNKVSFDTFDNQKARGKDTAEADTGSGLWMIVILGGIGGSVVALITNSNKKNRERRYLEALKQQSFNAAAAPAYQQFPATPPAQGVPLQPQQPYQQQPPGQGALPGTQASPTQPGYPARPS